MRSVAPWLMGFALLAGCASRPGDATAPAAELIAADEPPALPAPVALNEAALAALAPATRVAFLGETTAHLVVPLAMAPIDLDPATIAPAAVVMLGRTAPAQPDLWLPTRRWLRVDDSRDAAAIFLWVPREMIGERTTVRVGGTDVRIDRVVTRPRVPLASLPGGVLPSAFERFQPALDDASQRWRARFALRALGLDASSLGAFEDDTVEAFADALELRAAAVASALQEIDVALGDRLERTLGRSLVFPDGVIAPAWPEADASLEDLFAVVMDPTVPRAAAADRARQWLDGIPRAAAWINDDAGALGVRLHVAELRGEGDLVAARAAPSASCDPATLHPLLPRTVAEIDLRCRQRPATRTMRVDVGDWSATLDAIAAPREVGPPGAPIGPLLLPHSMRTLLAGQVAVPDAAHATAALIQRAPGEDRWRLYAECLAPEGESAEREDTLRVFFGTREFPSLTLEIRANGSSTRIAYDAKGAETRTTLEPVVRRERDRWIVFVDLPQDAFEPDGTAIVGAERVDARGVRSVWPRPVLPWEGTPPRVAFDTTTWRPLRSSQ